MVQASAGLFVGFLNCFLGLGTRRTLAVTYRQLQATEKFAVYSGLSETWVVMQPEYFSYPKGLFGQVGSQPRCSRPAES